MLRKRGLACAAALALVLSLSVAPIARAADGAITGPDNIWTHVQSWAQNLLVDWLGWGTAGQTDGPVSTYDTSDSSGATLPPLGPLDIGPDGTCTTDEGGTGDPDG